MNNNQTNMNEALINIKPLKQADVVQIIRGAETLDDAIYKMNGLAANGWLTLWDNATHHDGTSYRDLPEWKEAIKASVKLVDELKAETKASEQRIVELEAKLYSELKRVSALNSLRESHEKELEYYRKQDYSLAKSRLDGIEQSLNSERDMNQTLTNEITELQAHVNQLREALGKILVGYSDKYLVESISTEALSKTPPQSLIEHDNAVIQMCANEFNVDSNEYKTIQALKETV